MHLILFRHFDARFLHPHAGGHSEGGGDGGEDGDGDVQDFLPKFVLVHGSVSFS